VELTLKIHHHGSTPPMVIPLEGNSAVTFMLAMPPSLPPPLPPVPLTTPFGGYIPVGSCMTVNNELTSGYFRPTNPGWNYQNGVCSSGTSPMKCFYDGDVSTACVSPDYPGHESLSAYHDDAFAYDFGERVSFSQIALWATSCTSMFWTFSNDGINWWGGAIAPQDGYSGRQSFQCTAPGAQSPTWMDVGSQTARFVAFLSGSGATLAYELVVRRPDA